ncbi:MAG: AraC family transcriptional regulator ligand-binding domain-containing protein [Gammaproteobacteria bacterium]|nr:AraC family transcriptional regulator ligand-binding domain-containing protein [Gammaproteobacteria bacterium]MCP5201784.1 AraC family transcriptional regulator ligand-binding domain-containing protein [Gammaproteobacteria bacterium]
MKRPFDPDRILMPNTYVRLLTQEFDDLAAIAAGTGIAPEDLADYAHPITMRQHLRCIANILPLRQSPDWHLHWGKRMAENFHGAVTLAWLSAPTLGHGLDTFIKYMPDRIPYLDWRGRSHGESFRCEVTPLVDLAAVRHMLIEVPLLVMHEYVCMLHRGPMDDARIELTYAPTDYRDRYADYFLCPVAFGQPRNALVIPAAWRAIANIDFDEGAWHAALARCEAAARSDDERDVVERVREVLADALAQPAPAGLPTLQQVAARLHCSSRTVIRRLRAADTSFQAVAEEMLKDRAATLLDDPRNRVQDVAARLGYADSASFRKAFKRWFGVTPGAWRRTGGV